VIAFKNAFITSSNKLIITLFTLHTLKKYSFRNTV